jgi:hypothetical protein
LLDGCSLHFKVLVRYFDYVEDLSVSSQVELHGLIVMARLDNEDLDILDLDNKEILGGTLGPVDYFTSELEFLCFLGLLQLHVLAIWSFNQAYFIP